MGSMVSGNLFQNVLIYMAIYKRTLENQIESILIDLPYYPVSVMQFPPLSESQ